MSWADEAACVKIGTGGARRDAAVDQRTPHQANGRRTRACSDTPTPSGVRSRRAGATLAARRQQGAQRTTVSAAFGPSVRTATTHRRRHRRDACEDVNARARLEETGAAEGCSPWLERVPVLFCYVSILESGVLRRIGDRCQWMAVPSRSRFPSGVNR